MKCWIRSGTWQPAHAGGGSRGFSVECEETAQLGHAKPVHCAEEVLASLLADEVGLGVPHTRLGTCEGQLLAVSELWGPQSLDVPKLRMIDTPAADSDPFREALRRASGLLPFHSWIQTGDLKDEHVMVRPGPQAGSYEMASIDFASAFAWDGTGGHLSVPPGPPILVAEPHRDPQVIMDTISRIERLSNDSISKAVNDIADLALPADAKKRILQGLIKRKDRLRDIFLAAGWLT